MSQFCGSLTALSSRSLLTVILYCACGREAVSASIDAPAKAVQAMVMSFRLRYCMIIALSFGCASWVRARGGSFGTENLTREQALWAMPGVGGCCAHAGGVA